MSPSQIPQGDWVSAYRRLTSTLGEWIRSEPGWTVVEQPQRHLEISDERIRRSLEAGDALENPFEAPDLVISTPYGQLMVEVKFSSLLDGKGRIDLYAWTTLNRVRLLLRDPVVDEWEILTDSGIKLRQPWNRETFLTVARDLLDAPE